MIPRRTEIRVFLLTNNATLPYDILVDSNKNYKMHILHVKPICVLYNDKLNKSRHTGNISRMPLRYILWAIMQYEKSYDMLLFFCNRARVML